MHSVTQQLQTPHQQAMIRSQVSHIVKSLPLHLKHCAPLNGQGILPQFINIPKWFHSVFNSWNNQGTSGFEVQGRTEHMPMHPKIHHGRYQISKDTHNYETKSVTVCSRGLCPQRELQRWSQKNGIAPLCNLLAGVFYCFSNVSEPHFVDHPHRFHVNQELLMSFFSQPD